MDDYLIREGTHRRLWERLGAHAIEHAGVAGVHFAVWAPNAARVSVVGDFNGWDGRRNPMRRRGGVGVWEIFIPGLGEGAVYKYELRAADGSLLPLKADPVGTGAELRPQNASVVRRVDDFSWSDAAWLAGRGAAQSVKAPVSILEVHLGSWARGEGNRFLTYDELADRLVPYAVDMGFTHLELLPVNEHPFDGSWGYQPIGLFAPTSRHGTPARLRALRRPLPRGGSGPAAGLGARAFPDRRARAGPVRRHRALRARGPAPGVPPGLEHADLQFRPHARSPTSCTPTRCSGSTATMSTACGSMRWPRCSTSTIRARPDEWVPNKFGGRENLEAVDFLRRMNELAYGEHPGVMTVAEESTAWPGVSQADLGRRAGLRLQMEHGVDARHPGIHGQGPGPSPLASPPDDLRPALCLLRELRPAAQPRRGGARQGLDPGPDAGRHLAEVRQPARLLRLHVGPSRQEAPVHGPGVRRRAPSGTTSRAWTGTCSRSAGTRACSCWSRT